MDRRKLIKRAKPLLALLALLFLIGCGTQVPSGHRGVKYFKFGDGTEMGKIYEEGFNWHFPWNRIYVYKIQLEERKEDLQILSSDGATIMLEVSIWYRPDVFKLDSLQKTIGPGYFGSVVAPALRGVARNVVGQYKPEEIYSTGREVIAAEILNAMQELVAQKFVTIENVIIRNVQLPPKITEANLPPTRKPREWSMSCERKPRRRNGNGLKPRVLPTSRKSSPVVSLRIC
jgi:regulator of protease activity HflC (stomatin/prohibitin superfamily)